MPYVTKRIFQSPLVWSQLADEEVVKNVLILFFALQLSTSQKLFTVQILQTGTAGAASSNIRDDSS